MDPEKRYRQRTASAILKEDEVARIKHNLSRGISVRECAEAYGVAAETIRRISRGETWAWVRPQGSAPPPQPSAPPSPGMQASLERFKEMMGTADSPVERMMREAQGKRAADDETDRQIDELMKGDSK